MNINAIEEIYRLLDDIDAKIKHLESSPNRAFALIEYETISLFHHFNLCLKKFWDEFDRYSANQLLQFRDIDASYSQLTSKYVKLFREQLDYLEAVLDIEHGRVKELPPVWLSEDNCTDIISHYQDCCKSDVDDDGEPLYRIGLESGNHFERVKGKLIPIDLYIFESEKLNNAHYNGLASMYYSLDKLFYLMCAVSSYPDKLLSGYRPSQEEIIKALERELRLYAKEDGEKMKADLRRTAQELKPHRNSPLTSNEWGQVMQLEDDLFDLAVDKKLTECSDKTFKDIDDTMRQDMTDNYGLLDKIKKSCDDEKLFDVRYSAERHLLLTSLRSDNLELFCKLILRRNIIHREMYPEKLGKAYEEWVMAIDKEVHDGNCEVNCGLTTSRQSKLDEMIGIMKKGNWKGKATVENITQLLNTVFGRDTSVLEEGDAAGCEEMWDFVEKGNGGEKRLIIVPGNLAGFFSEENLLAGTPTEISKDLFGKSNKNLTNYINKGNSNRCSEIFKKLRPFLLKYTNLIVRQAQE